MQTHGQAFSLSDFGKGPRPPVHWVHNQVLPEAGGPPVSNQSPVCTRRVGALRRTAPSLLKQMPPEEAPKGRTLPAPVQPLGVPPWLLPEHMAAPGPTSPLSGLSLHSQTCSRCRCTEGPGLPSPTVLPGGGPSTCSLKPRLHQALPSGPRLPCQVKVYVSTSAR